MTEPSEPFEMASGALMALAIVGAVVLGLALAIVALAVEVVAAVIVLSRAGALALVECARQARTKAKQEEHNAKD